MATSKPGKCAAAASSADKAAGHEPAGIRLNIGPGASSAWAVAIWDWKLGNPEPLAAKLCSDDPIHPDARQWLAALAAGTVKRWNAGQRRAHIGRITLDSPAAAAIRALDAEQSVIALYETLRRVYAAQRAEARADGRVTSGMPNDEAAAAEALAMQGMKGGVRQIMKLKARRRKASIVSLKRISDLY